MNRPCSPLALIALVFCAQHAVAFEVWRQIGTAASGAPFFVDFGSISSSNAGITFRSRVKAELGFVEEFKLPGIGDVDLIEHWAIKCQPRAFSRYRQEFARNRDTIVKVVEAGTAWEAPLAPVPPGTMLVTAVDAVCAEVELRAAQAKPISPPLISPTTAASDTVASAPAHAQAQPSATSQAEVAPPKPPLALIERKPLEERRAPKLATKSATVKAPDSKSKQAPESAPLSYYDQEAKSYVEASARIGAQPPAIRAIVENYWQRRLDVADRIDKGQLGRETGISLIASYERQAMEEIGRIESEERQKSAAREREAAEKARAEETARLTQEQLANSARALQAQQEAQARAARDAERQRLFETGLKLLFPPAPAYAPPRRTVCTTSPYGVVTCQER